MRISTKAKKTLHFVAKKRIETGLREINRAHCFTEKFSLNV